MSKARTRARELAVQAIYQWQLTGQDVLDIQKQFAEENDLKKIDRKFFRDLLKGVPSNLEELDQRAAMFLDRKIEEVDPIERAIIRIGAYELVFRSDVPVKVVINESVELAKKFGAEQSHKYVNSILDGIAKKQRHLELVISKDH